MPVNDETRSLAKQRTSTVISIMQQSQNRFIRDAVSMYHNRKDIQIQIGYTEFTQEASTKLVNINGQLTYVVTLNGNSILNKYDALDLAFTLTHELTHVNDFIKDQDSLPSTSTVDERMAKNTKDAQDQEQVIEEEARGYGTEMLANIYEYGLGMRGFEGTHWEHWAAELIRRGGDINGTSWREFVRDNILQRDPETGLLR